MSEDLQTDVAAPPAPAVRVPAHTKWTIRDGLDHHDRGDLPPEVIEGSEPAFRIADSELACLCHGIPAGARHGIHVGDHWQVTFVRRLSEQYGLFLVESLVDC
jgi:hypothetical protein